jgi:hypothetical protein
VLTQTLPLALAAAISELEGVPAVALVAVLGAAGVALGLAGTAGFAAAELVSVEPACAFAKAGEMPIVIIKKKASIHRVSLVWE